MQGAHGAKFAALQVTKCDFIEFTDQLQPESNNEINTNYLRTLHANNQVFPVPPPPDPHCIVDSFTQH